MEQNTLISKNFQSETWRDIDEYLNIYQVSSIGRIKSLSRKIWTGQGYWKSEDRILKLTDSYGYKRIRLLKDRKYKFHFVHRLVAKAFIPNIEDKPEVNHINEIKDDNRVENLEWCTRLDNIRHGTGLERKIKFTKKKVGQYSLDGKLIKIWESTKEIGRNGFNQGNVASCCRGERYKKVSNFIWKYL